ncbi:MAG TPA: 50S ribosomal protein L13 [Dehalococcoidales bacterium]|nr:MAG: 50S ribosomal protein L13 [Chloroflexi bacterium RBG_16_60_22]HJX12289.1 50S ribosomal protein L13 [Dehalococcoidales bacterium]
MKTYSARPADIERAWHLIDAADQTLGRLSTRIARLLMGKHKPMFTPSQDTGDFVVVINAEKVRVTGNKGRQKLYYRHSGYPGGFKSVTLEKMMQDFPTRAIEHSVRGMLPHTRLGARMKKRLRVYAGAAHPHESQFQTEKKEAK